MVNAELSIGEAVLISLVGMAVVAAVLVLLMGLVKILSLVLRGSEKKQSAPELETAPASVKAVPALPTPAPGSAGTFKLHNVAESEAAMVMAVVADELNTPLNELRFISIKRLEE